MTAAGQPALLFRALADPTRRAVFERLALGEMSVSDLKAGFAVSQPAISQHLAALRQAGLVSERRKGRFAYYRAEPQALAPLEDWVSRQRALWPARIDKLKTVLKDMDEERDE
ncbi:MAG: winged helix-turn-helix transcriptional regulator [Caulobacteraceae bacterium]|nr:winged helix-turn-helix transcriptional regulator [Caulobacteraceae bacterium]